MAMGRVSRDNNETSKQKVVRNNEMKKSVIISTLVLCTASLISTASADQVVTTPNGTWDAYPGQSATHQAAVQQPINADGSSNFKANGNAVIPIKFALSQGLGPFVFESIYSNTDTDDDFSFLSFAPNVAVTFSQITQLIASYTFTTGNCHGGALRWSVRTGTNQAVFIYYGDYPNFTNCTTTSQSGTNMIGLGDLRYDTSQYAGGTFYDSYAHALTLMGSLPITRVSLVLDAGWGGDQRLTLASATVATAAFTDTFTPQPVTPPTAVCPTSQALIGITKVSTSPSGDVMEAQTVQPQDNNGIYRIVDCKYMYNLATSSLMGTGTYNVYATIGGDTFPVATFSLK
jgi:hypothetical protein